MKNSKKTFEHWKKISLALAIYDIISVNLSFLLALYIRYDGDKRLIPPDVMNVWKSNVCIYSVICIIVFAILKLYRSIWRYASYSEFLRCVWGALITGGIYTLIISMESVRMPIAYYVIGIVLQMILLIFGRFSYRLHLMYRARTEKNIKETKNIMIIGAGSAGEMILRDLQSRKHPDKKACCIIDDNANKWNRYMDGVPIVGGRDDILKNVEKYHIDEIYVAIPAVAPAARRDILNICSNAGCKVKNLPGVYQIVNGDVDVSSLRKVNIEDLLGRETIKVDMEEIYHFIQNKTILVTGGGGSIGSELSRQIAGHNPKKLIIFDVYENSAYDIEQELREKYPKLDLSVVIGSVRDSRKMLNLFEEYRPDVVYHAAAHKHVPLMEGSPCEAIKNNVIGTYKTAYAAAMYGCQRFVLISTDKAVNPTNIMGASKRLCEMVIQSFDSLLKEGKGKELLSLYTHEGEELPPLPEKTHTDYVAVRFGNVLGSNGSVIPLFRKQIEAGGPVTVTHPDIIRYFMTIPEAVSLVLQAGTYAQGGEIFILDMGAPVKIDTLARNLIKLSGLRPDEDIEISYTGLRPGEKLYEEKLMAEEGMRKTPNDLIHVGSPINFDKENFVENLEWLMGISYMNDEDIRNKVAQIVLTYHPAGQHGTEKKGKAYEELRKSMSN